MSLPPGLLYLIMHNMQQPGQLGNNNGPNIPPMAISALGALGKYPSIGDLARNGPPNLPGISAPPPSGGGK